MSTGRVDAQQSDADEDRHAEEAPRRKRHKFAALERFRARIRRNKVLNTTWRVAVFVVGAAILLAGVVMLVAPGPGWLAIVLGFAILATEFVWAKRALHKAQRAAKAAKDKAFDPRVRRRNQILLASAGVLVIAIGVAYVGFYGMTMPWNTDLVQHLP